MSLSVISFKRSNIFAFSSFEMSDSNWELVNRFYQNKIEFYNQILDKLFFDIVTFETKLTKKKQQKLQQDEDELEQLFRLIVLFLKSLALVNTYEEFKMKMIVLAKENILLFNATFNKHYEIVLIMLIVLIKNDQNIDFTIN